MIESFLFFSAQLFEDKIILHTDTGMIQFGMIPVWYKQNITDEAVQSFFHFQTFFVILAGKIGFYLSLGIEFRTHGIKVMMQMADKSLANFIAPVSEHGIQHVVTDEGPGHEVFPEIKPETSDFFFAHGQGRDEMSQQTMYGVSRDFPDTEESQNVVNAVSREVFCHLGKAFPPPQVVVFLHNFPVVSRESPVLSVCGECIGRCSRLSVHVEIIGFRPCFHTAPADADGNVALENDSPLAGMAGSVQQLLVELVLYIIMECNLWIDFVFRIA